MLLTNVKSSSPFTFVMTLIDVESDLLHQLKSQPM